MMTDAIGLQPHLLATYGNIANNNQHEGVLKLFASIADIADQLDLSVDKHAAAYGGYEYLSLEKLLAKLTPILKEHKLILDFPQTMGHQGARITSLETGAFKASWVPLGVSTDMQANGKQMTYDVRYAALYGLLGRQADKDTDGNDKAMITPAKSQRKSAPMKSKKGELF